MSFIDTRLKIRRFFKKYKKIIIFIIIIWAIIFVVNYILKNMPKEDIPETTYEPNVSVMTEDEVPDKWHETIESTIETFVQRCNNKEYEAAYNMLSDDCKAGGISNLKLFPRICRCEI